MRLSELTTLMAQRESSPGDGRAVFIEDGTEAEYDQYVKESEQGWKSFNNKVKELLKI